VRKGGIIGGHDFRHELLFPEFGVSKAVTEFALKNKLKLQTDLIDWWIEK
jgi:hypothetical protein